jgi:hypothetical protein
MGHYVTVAGGTADSETAQHLIIKRCLCHTAFCNCKCFNIGLFHSSTVFYTFICNRNEYLHADGSLSSYSIT